MILRSFHTLIGYCLVLKKVAKHNLKQKKEILHTIKEDGFLLTLGSKCFCHFFHHYYFAQEENILNSFEVVKHSKLQPAF